MRCSGFEGMQRHTCRTRNVSRGLEGSGRKVHREPFTNATSRFLPEETPKISFRTCAVVGNDGELMQRGQVCMPGPFAVHGKPLARWPCARPAPDDVQNGQSLNAAADDQGSEIDSHDAVYRMNQVRQPSSCWPLMPRVGGRNWGPSAASQAPTNQRVAGHVGKRTSVRVINRAWSRGYSGSYKRLLDDDPDGMILMATRAATRSVALACEMGGWHTRPRR